MREMTAERADWIRRSLGLSYEQITDGMNKLAGTSYGRTDAHRWFKGKRQPSVTLTLYLRLSLRDAWHIRRAIRGVAAKPASDLESRASRIINLGSRDVISRFEKRLILSEFDLAEQIRRQTGTVQSQFNMLKESQSDVK